MDSIRLPGRVMGSYESLGHGSGESMTLGSTGCQQCGSRT